MDGEQIKVEKKVEKKDKVKMEMENKPVKNKNTIEKKQVKDMTKPEKIHKPNQSKTLRSAAGGIM